MELNRWWIAKLVELVKLGKKQFQFLFSNFNFEIIHFVVKISIFLLQTITLVCMIWLAILANNFFVILHHNFLGFTVILLGLLAGKCLEHEKLSKLIATLFP